MAQVSLQINGYPYVIGCADGEEEHLLSLAAGLDTRIEEIKTATGLTGEGRLLVMAAMVLADEVHDLRGRPGEQAAAAPSAEKPAAKPSRRLRGIAKRAEDIADLVETAPEAAMAAEAEPANAASEGGEPAHTETHLAENIAAPPEHA